MTRPWPWPDDRLERRSRIARMYRDELRHHMPEACDEVDDMMAAFGQGWIIDYTDQDLDLERPLTIEELAQWVDVDPRTIDKWVQRGHIQRRRDQDGRAVFLVSDVVEYQKKRRRKQ